MDHLNNLSDLRGELSVEKVPEVLATALAEYRKCLEYDEEIVLPAGMSQEIKDRLAHGRKLALARRTVISEAMGKALAHLDIGALPKEFQKFHPDFMATVAPEHLMSGFHTWDHEKSR